MAETPRANVLRGWFRVFLICWLTFAIFSVVYIASEVRRWEMPTSRVREAWASEIATAAREHIEKQASEGKRPSDYAVRSLEDRKVLGAGAFVDRYDEWATRRFWDFQTKHEGDEAFGLAVFNVGSLNKGRYERATTEVWVGALVAVAWFVVLPLCVWFALRLLVKAGGSIGGWVADGFRASKD